jgi:predicted nucleic acid-binding protein
VIALDTSVVVRYLVGVPVEQSLRARAFIDGHERLGVSTLVLLETGYALRTKYGVSRQDTLEALLELVTSENVEILGLPKNLTVQALARAREHGGALFADALIVTIADVAGAEAIATFDRQMRRHGLPVVEP